MFSFSFFFYLNPDFIIKSGCLTADNIIISPELNQSLSIFPPTTFGRIFELYRLNRHPIYNGHFSQRKNNEVRENFYFSITDSNIYYPHYH